MNMRLVTGLLAVTIVLVTLAAFVITAPQGAKQAGVGDLVFPEIAEHLNSIQDVVIETANDVVTVKRDESGVWRLSEKSGYPVKPELIRRTIAGLSRLTVVSPMTRNPEKFVRLGVEDLSRTAASTQVSFFTANDLFVYLVGQYVVPNDEARDGQAEMYIREAGVEQSWHARGDFAVPATPLDWLDLKIVEVSRNDIQRVVVQHADGEKVIVSMVQEGDDNFVIENVPSGLQPRTEFIANSVGSSLGWLAVEDVDRQGDIPDDSSRTTYTTWGGEVFVITVFSRNDMWWFMVEQTAGEGMEAFNARTADWAYAISEYKAKDYAKRMSDLTKPAGGE